MTWTGQRDCANNRELHDVSNCPVMDQIPQLRAEFLEALNWSSAWTSNDWSVSAVPDTSLRHSARQTRDWKVPRTYPQNRAPSMSLIIGSDPPQLERALAAADGLLAGMRVLDKAEPLDQVRQPDNITLYDEFCLLDYAGDVSRATTALGDDPPPFQSHEQVSSMELLPLMRPDLPAILGADGRYRDGSTNTTNLVHRKNPLRLPTCYNGAPTDGDASTQWTVLRCLRQAIVAHHRRFQEVIGNSPAPATSKLIHAYPNAKAIWEKGILTFRDILSGMSPTGLADVFAFASLSYAVSILLLEYGRLKREHILLGLEVWRDSRAGGFCLAGADAVFRGGDPVAAASKAD
ncbi:hypothetical protein B0H66DRAFT_217945 [Apodospora peruviana]|uniref:Uncharacterized protein n=1 Tax=Apodospora peruviana TaxID=516989 RepID=A0AAE0IDB8_9PEZI|nr:hypothetical protein B0H66DRAFT_217945 [Apodospora peruviana]